MINVYLFDGANEQTLYVARALRLLRHKNIRLWIERSMAGVPPYVNWKDKNIIDCNVGELSNSYFEWNINNQIATTLSYEMRSLWWHVKNQKMHFCIISSQQQPK